MGEPTNDLWWHEAHSLHDEAHHRAHRPLDLCVPLWSRLADAVAAAVANYIVALLAQPHPVTVTAPDGSVYVLTEAEARADALDVEALVLALDAELSNCGWDVPVARIRAMVIAAAQWGSA